ncbi:MAG: hypothetical protein RLZ44_297 [Pseudomonadota bacterium]
MAATDRCLRQNNVSGLSDPTRRSFIISLDANPLAAQQGTVEFANDLDRRIIRRHIKQAVTLLYPDRILEITTGPCMASPRAAIKTRVSQEPLKISLSNWDRKQPHR